MISEADVHPGSGSGPAPNGKGTVALQNGVVLKKRSELESHRRVDIFEAEDMTSDVFLANGVDGKSFVIREITVA
jgi:hypothetical protein